MAGTLVKNLMASGVDVGRPKKSEGTVPVRLPKSLVKRLRGLAAYAGMDLGDYALLLFTPVIDQAEAELRQRLSAPGTPAPEAKKPRK